MTKRASLNATNLWKLLRAEAEKAAQKEPALAAFFQSRILQHGDFGEALCGVLARELAANDARGGLDYETLFDVFQKSCADHPDIVASAKRDLLAVMDRDPATTDLRTPLLYFKGYQALQAHRMAHYLWGKKRKDFALLLQSQSSLRFQVDIHPAARLGHGIMLDHATGFVVGETAVIGNDVSILHGVTLGGTGKHGQDRHPKIADGVLLGAGATVLGNITIGKGSRVAAGSMVLRDVPPHVTVVGVPAKIVGKSGCAKPGTVMDQIVRVAPETQSGR